MANVTIDELRNLVHEHISAQKEWVAEMKERDAERDKKYAERQAEYEKEQKQRQAEYENEQKQRQAEYEKRQKQLEKSLGKLGNSYGEQIEAMFVNLGTKFNELGYSFPKEAGRTKFHDENRQCLAEVDHLLENGDVIMPVEIKAKLKKEDVDDHIERLGIISKYNIVHNDKRKVLGTVAGGVVPQNVLRYAQKRGLYVLVQNGDSIEIAKIPANFKPHEW